MSKNYLTFFIIPFIMPEVATAKVVDCRIVTGGTTECNPYSSRFVKAKEVKYDLDRKKLIVVKTLPVPKEKASIKVVSVADMIERYVKVEDSMRFKGSEKSPLARDAIDEKHKIQARKQKIYTRIEKIRLERKKLLEKMQKFKEEKEKKRLDALKLAEEEKKKVLEKKRREEGIYVVEEGDSLSTIAAKFNMKTNVLRELNNMKKSSMLRIGKKLTIPYSQKKIDVISRAEYVIEKGDTLSSIAQEFNLTSKAIKKFNHLKKGSTIRLGQKILLPLPHKLAEAKKIKMLRSYGKRKLRVTATAYSSHRAQTDKTPFLAAWNNRLRPGMKIIAVSRDMLTRYGMRNGTKVRIAGLPGIYRVRDKMNKRYRKRIDIYMGVNRRKALRWGRRNVVIYW